MMRRCRTSVVFRRPYESLQYIGSFDRFFKKKTVMRPIQLNYRAETQGKSDSLMTHGDLDTTAYTAASKPRHFRLIGTSAMLSGSRVHICRCKKRNVSTARSVAEKKRNRPRSDTA
jgi:hypothetical protein